MTDMAADNNKTMKSKGKKKTNSKAKKMISVRSFSDMKAFTVLHLSRRKLNCIDDEEELFRSVLISNTVKSVKQEMSFQTAKKPRKKAKDKLVKRVKNQINLLGTQSHKRLNVWKRNLFSLMSGKRKMKRFQSTGNLLE